MLSVIVNGHEYSLDDGTYGKLRGHDGWGMPASHRLASQGPQQHGDTDEGQYLMPRFGSLLFQIPNTELDDMYAAREPLLELFHPENSPILKWDLDKGVRYIDCYYAENLSMPWSPRDWANANFTLTLKCPDPTFYDPMVNTNTWVGMSGTALTIPWVIPTIVGGSTLNQNQTINYYGTWYEYPEIEIRGPATNLMITNSENGYKLNFSGVTIAAGESRIIDTRYGYKTVLDGAGTNKISDLTSDSDLGTWRFERKRFYEIFRNNTIRVFATGISNQTRIIFRWNNRYIGI